MNLTDEAASGRYAEFLRIQLREIAMTTVESIEDLELGRTAFLFDLDGTLVDSVYQHVLAWREAMAGVGIELAVWRIHRRIGMSGGLMANAILRETGHKVTREEAGRLVRLHAEAYARLTEQVRPLPGAGFVGLLNGNWRTLGDCY